ncbi:MAG: aminotransferase class III-fold pyridoxal phosphate-dependent enzyme [Acidimicrobiia bacterium]|nr:aminotransferase class III-fold pyridoxal phosphate-dependent enzyme [Acidimicrobiia bacterium]
MTDEAPVPPTLLHSFAPPAKTQFRQLVRGEGVRVWDADGTEYIDALASLWYCQVGHGRSEIIDAVAEQMHQLSAYNTFDPWTNEPAEAVARAVVERSPLPDGRVFLCCSGSESIDTAIKLARVVSRLRGEHRQHIVRRTRGYHGVNLGGTTAQGIEANREGWGDLLPHFLEVDPDNIESAATAFAEQGDQIAAVITEPLQGAGGVHPPADGYLERLRELCDTHGALLVFDEVICGFGRTGQWFASQTYDVTPDVITFAKGVTSGYQPLGGVIVSRAVCDQLEADPEYVFRHGYTYSGHPAACAAGLANLEIIEREDLVARATHVGARLTDGLRSLVDDGALAGVRGEGAIWAAVLPDGVDPIPIRDRMVDTGVIVRGIVDCIAFCPPLVIDDADIDRCVDVLAASIPDP